MDEALFITILKNISIFASVVGILAGLDLLFGARVICGIRKILDKAFDIDRAIVKISSAIRKKLDSGAYIDEVITKTRARVVLGSILVLFSLLMASLVVTTR